MNRYRTDKFNSGHRHLASSSGYLYICEYDRVVSQQYEFYYGKFPIISINEPYRNGKGWATYINYLSSEKFYDLKSIYIDDFNDDCIESIPEMRDRKLIELGI